MYPGVISPCRSARNLPRSKPNALPAASSPIFSPVSPEMSWWRSRKLPQKWSGGVIRHDSRELDRGLVAAQVFDPDARPVGVTLPLPALIHVGEQIQAETALE